MAGDNEVEGRLELGCDDAASVLETLDSVELLPPEGIASELDQELEDVLGAEPEEIGPALSVVL